MSFSDTLLRFIVYDGMIFGQGLTSPVRFRLTNIPKYDFGQLSTQLNTCESASTHSQEKQHATQKEGHIQKESQQETQRLRQETRRQRSQMLTMAMDSRLSPPRHAQCELCGEPDWLEDPSHQIADIPMPEAGHVCSECETAIKTINKNTQSSINVAFMRVRGDIA